MKDTESYTDRSADALAPSCYGHSRTDHCPNGRAIAESGCWSRHDADAAEHAPAHQPRSRHARGSRSPAAQGEPFTAVWLSRPATY